MTEKKVSVPRVLNVGRFQVAFFPYWIGVSRRYVRSLGQVLDLGFVKIVW